MSEQKHKKKTVYLIVCSNCNKALPEDDVKKYKITGNCLVRHCHLVLDTDKDHKHHLCKNCYNNVVISGHLKKPLKKLIKEMKK